MQVEFPRTEYCPAGHSEQLGCPDELVYVFIGHGEHLSDAEFFEKVPGRHSAQFLPAPAPIVPAGQSVHLKEPGLECLPFGHFWHSVVEPPLLKVFFGHALHSLPLVSYLYCPFGQLAFSASQGNFARSY